MFTCFYFNIRFFFCAKVVYGKRKNGSRKDNVLQIRRFVDGSSAGSRSIQTSAGDKHRLNSNYVERKSIPYIFFPNFCI